MEDCPWKPALLSTSARSDQHRPTIEESLRQDSSPCGTPPASSTRRLDRYALRCGNEPRFHPRSITHAAVRALTLSELASSRVFGISRTLQARAHPPARIHRRDPFFL